MDKENIGGISLDDIMAAALSGLDDQDSETNTGTVKKEPQKTIKAVTRDGPANGTGNSSAGIDNPSGIDTDPGLGIVPDPDPGIVPDPDPGIVPDPGSGIVPDPGSGIAPDSGSGIDIATGSDIDTTPVINPTTSFTNSLNGEAEKMYDKVFDLLSAGRTAEAVQIAQRLVDENVSNEFAWFAYANAKEDWGEKDLAIKGYKQAIAIKPDFYLAYDAIASIYGEKEDYQTALEYARKAVEINSEYSGAKVKICAAICETEGIAAAISCCEDFIKNTENNEELKNLLGSFFVMKAFDYIYEIPDDFDKPTDTELGFISKLDLKDARDLCNKAMAYLTIDSEYYNDYKEKASSVLEMCDVDEALYPMHKKPIVILHTALLAFFYLMIVASTFGIAFPLLIAVYVLPKSDKVPGYILNYMNYFGCDNPLSYLERDKRESIDKKNLFNQSYKEIQAGKRATHIQNDIKSQNEDGFWLYIGKLLLKDAIYFLKCRWAYYKRFIEERKAMKNDENKTMDIKQHDKQN